MEEQRFLRPASAAEAVRLRADSGGQFLAGGTELGSLGYGKDQTLISLRDLELDFIREEAGAVVLGATVTLQQIADSDQLGQRGLSLVRDCAAAVSIRSVRNAATVGGSIGSSRTCSDLLPALLVLEATVMLLGAGGESEIPLADHLSAPQPGALITGVRVPRPGGDWRLSRRRFSRSANDLALINVALGLRLDGEAVAEVRLAIGGVAATVIRLTAAEQALCGVKPGDDRSAVTERFAEAVRSSVAPTTDLRGSADFKTHLAAELARQALADALDGATEEGRS